MAAPLTPTNPLVQAANGQILVSWDQTATATTYLVNRSQDNITYALVATITGSPLSYQYLDTAVTLGTNYWYTVQASNVDGNSPATAPIAAIPAPTSEMTLSQLRLAAQQRADRVNSNFVGQAEWRSYINQAMFELYDLLVTVYEDYYLAPPIQFIANGSTNTFPLPDGVQTYMDAYNPNNTIVAAPFLKLMGVDLLVNSSTNARVTINKFNFIDRNKYLYPNSASTIYGVFNLQYRVMGNQIQFIPFPAGNQGIWLWYIPRLKELLLETDTTHTGISGWLEYVIVRAAKYALDKEEQDTTILTNEILFLKNRIESAAMNRDAGQPDTVSDTRNGNGYGNGWGGGNSGSGAGW